MMFLSGIVILALCFNKVFAEPPIIGPPPTSPPPPTNPPPPTTSGSTLRPTTPLKTTDPPDGNDLTPSGKSTQISTPNSEPTDQPESEHCRGDDCRPPPNLIPPIVGSLCGLVVVALIGVFILWYYLRRKTKLSKEIPKTPAINFIEQPALYTGAISTTDSTSKLYGMSASAPRHDSISSQHYYEKITYNDQS